MPLPIQLQKLVATRVPRLRDIAWTLTRQAAASAGAHPFFRHLYWPTVAV